MAPWRSGYAEVCKTFYTGSIPVGASNFAKTGDIMNEEQNTAPGVSRGDAPGDVSDASAGQRPTSNAAKRWIVAVIGALVLISAIWFVVSMVSKTSAPGQNGQSSAAQKLFDDMARAAAAKSRVQLTYAEKSFKSKADYTAHTVLDQQYSVAEVDVPTKEYRAVYANQQGSSTGLTYYTVRRCLTGKMFEPEGFALAYKTLDAVKGVLQQPFRVTVDNSEANDCSLSDPDHPGRVTDGIIPVGLSQDQIEGWLRNLHEASFVQLEDKGMTTYNQKPVRKLRVVTNSLAGAGNFFDAVKKGAGLQLTTDSGAVGADSYRLDHMATSDNIDGFYLIDEQTKLPLYSEFVTLALLKDDSGEAPSNQNGTTQGRVFKQLYAYPESLSLGQTSTINTLE